MTAATIVQNIAFGPLPLPSPYNHILLNENCQVTLAVDKATLLAQLGGADAIRGLFSLTEVDTTDGLSLEDASPEVLYVGRPSYSYLPPNDSWLYVDGTNPPTVAGLRLMDQVTGLPVTLNIVSGVVTLT